VQTNLLPLAKQKPKHIHNPILHAVVALIPLITGFVWYNPKVFGTPWLQASGLTPESAKAGFNPAMVFGIAYLASFLLAIALGPVVVHQMALFSLARPEPGQAPSPIVTQWLHDSFTIVGHNYRRYRHGAFHGAIFGIFAILPVITVNALFERRGFKYIAINAGFWILNCILMGAVLCHWLLVEPH